MLLHFSRFNRLAPVFFDSDFTDIATELLHNLWRFESLDVSELDSMAL